MKGVSPYRELKLRIIPASEINYMTKTKGLGIPVLYYIDLTFLS